VQKVNIWEPPEWKRDIARAIKLRTVRAAAFIAKYLHIKIKSQIHNMRWPGLFTTLLVRIIRYKAAEITFADLRAIAVPLKKKRKLKERKNKSWNRSKSAFNCR